MTGILLYMKHKSQKRIPSNIVVPYSINASVIIKSVCVSSGKKTIIKVSSFPKGWMREAEPLPGHGTGGGEEISFYLFLVLHRCDMYISMASPQNNQECRKLRPKDSWVLDSRLLGTLNWESLDLNRELPDSKATLCPLHPTSFFTSSFQMLLCFVENSGTALHMSHTLQEVADMSASIWVPACLDLVFSIWIPYRPLHRHPVNVCWNCLLKP